jgi:hypothetical protein
MAIEFTCPTCGKLLKLRDEAAGKTGKCPQCKAVITVPSAGANEDDMFEILPPNAPPARKPPVAPPKPVPPPPPASAKPAPPSVPPKPTVPGAESKATGRACPGCAKPLPEKAVICVNCGFNLKTGKKLSTVFEAPKSESEPEKPAKPEKPDESGPAKT